MIRAHGLTKRFGHHAVLDGVDLTVDPGERVALLGLNGAGKTTLIRCVLGLIPFEGDLAIDGCDVRRRGREARERLGYVPQRAPHFAGTLDDVVGFFSELRGIDPQAVALQMHRLGMPLEEHREKPVSALSGGMLQKMLLALALGAGIPLLLLDEPTANLDPRARRDFLRALRDVDDGTTILLASHRLADVEAVADRLVVLHAGHIVYDGTIQELRGKIGATVTLWVEVPQDVRDLARSHMRSACGLKTVISNGAALGVRVERADRADVVVALRDAGIAVSDFWTEAPALHDLLEGALGLKGNAG